MSLEKQIQEWVAVDNQIKTLSSKVKELRDVRNISETTILKYIETNKIDKATTSITISDGKLRFVSCKQTAPLTLKYVSDCLEKCIKNKDQVEYIMSFIREQREVKLTTDIKRFYSNS